MLPARSLRPILREVLGLSGLLGLLVAAGCARVPEAAFGPGALLGGLSRAAGVELVVDDLALAPAAEPALERWSRAGFRARCVGAGGPGSSGAGAPWARVVVTTSRSEGAAELARPFGVELAEGRAQFTFKERTFARPDTLVVATGSDPARPGLPLTLVLGNDAGAALAFLANVVPAWRREARVYEGGMLALAVEPGGPTGAVVREKVPPVSAHRDDYAGVLPLPPGFSAVAAARSIERPRLDEYLAAVRRARETASAWVELAQAAPPTLVAYADAARLRDAGLGWPLHELARASLLARNRKVDARIDALLAPGLAHDHGRAAAELVLLEALGPPRRAWLLDAASLDAADHYFGRELEEWCAALALLEERPGAEELFDPQACARFSPHLVRPLRALLVRELRREREGELFGALWTGAAGWPEDGGELFERALARAVRERRDGALERRAEHAAGSALPERLHGVALVAPPGPTGGAGTDGGGLGSERAAAELARVQDVGADAVSFASVLAARAGAASGRAVEAPFVLGALEGDAALAASIARARAAGLFTVLSPQLLSHPAGDLAGEQVRGAIDADERAFFEDYERFVEHYALLGELCGADALSLGSGIPNATRSAYREGEPRSAALDAVLDTRAREWPRLARRARQGFAGLVTFAAGWPQQAREVAFWPELDLVSIDLHLALGPRERAGPAPEAHAREAVRQAFDGLAALARETGRPLVVSGLGFRSTARAWRGWSSAGGPTAAAEQARLLGLVAGVLDDAGPDAWPGVRGVFVRNWSLAPDGVGAERGFSPRGKPGERELARILGAR